MEQQEGTGRVPSSLCEAESLKISDGCCISYQGLLFLGRYYTRQVDDRVFFIDPDFEIKRAEYASVFSKRVERAPWPFSLRSVSYFCERERFGSTRDPLRSSESSEGIRNGMTSETVMRLNISLLAFSRNGVQHPTEPSPRSQAFLFNAFMPGESIGSKTPSGDLGHLHFAVRTTDYSQTTKSGPLLMISFIIISFRVFSLLMPIPVRFVKS
jgi:hypothetical protein